MIQVGDIKLYLFNDSTVMADPGGAFGLVPRALWSKYIQDTEHHLIPMAQHNLLIQTPDKNIIVDTGYGNLVDDRSRAWLGITGEDGLHRGLASIGIDPADIDLVINTHLHSDHCTGNHRLNEDGQIVAAFPNAEYVVQRREYEDAMRPNERTRATYIASNFQPLIESGQMRLLDGDTQIADGIWGIITAGHTPAHMSVRIESKGEYAAFLCDLASFAVHFERLGWMTAYDVEPLVTLETKRRWQEWALETHAILIFPHDTIRPMGRLTRDAKGNPTVQALENPYDV